jgi:uncharacterized protein
MLRVGLVLVLLLGTVAPAQDTVPGRDSKKLQALILTGYTMHDWKTMSRALVEILQRTGRFEVRVNEEPAGSGAETFRGYDVLVLNYTNYKGKFGPTWPDVTREAFLGFLRGGKGVVAFHSAFSSFEEWPEYDRVLGGAWRATGSHAPYHTFRVDLVDREHPITRGLTPSFLQPDELSYGLTMQKPVHVLATAFDDPKNCSPAPANICGSGKSQPLIWTLDYGKGRVFGTLLGHDMNSISTPGFAATFQRGTEWAATGAVTIPPPAEMKAR